MYISEFICGVLATVCAELLLVILYAIFRGK